jgi:hypothetical protein
MIALYAVTGALMLLSAYGATCIAWNPGYSVPIPCPPPPFDYRIMAPYVFDAPLIFQISNIITWVGAFAWGLVIYAVLTQKSWSYWLALGTSAVGFIFGLIPALIADTYAAANNNEGTSCAPDIVPRAFEIGSPHWARTFASALVLIILIAIFVIAKLQKKSVLKYTGLESAMVGNVARQLVMMSLFLFWLSFVSFLGTEFMAEAHVLQGINVWETIQIQSIGAWVTGISGGTMLTSGLIFNQVKSMRSISTTSGVL